jgi:hypothetical protein
VPPQPVQERIARRLRLLAENPPQRRADQFRLEQLQHRFATYSQNWERMLREREEGRSRIPVGAVSESPSAGNAPSVRSVDPGESGSLYERYVAAKREHGQEVQVDQGAFEEQLASERRKLEDKLGHPVRFNVLVQGGRVKLAARKDTTGDEGE